MARRKNFAGVSLLFACSIGCWLVAVRGPPDDLPPGPAPLECTSKSLAPGVDAVGAVFFGIPAILGIVGGLAESCSPDVEFGCALGKAITLVFGLTSGLISTADGPSSWFGFSRVARCSEESDRRTVTSWLLPRLRAPWDSRVSEERLSVIEARRFCNDRQLHLPSRNQVQALSAELRSGSERPHPLSIWTRELQLATDASAAEPGPAAGLEVMTEAGPARALVMDLATGADSSSNGSDEKFLALCVAQL